MDSSLKEKENLYVLNHSIASHNLAILRDKNTPSELFRNATKRIAQILFFHATENLPIIKSTVNTPLAEAQVEIMDPQAEIIIAPILRAGLVFSEVASEILPEARMHHIGLYRDETTLQPVSYYNNLPKKITCPEKNFVYLIDPMLATGGSAVAAIKLFIDLGIPEQNIRFLSLISVPEGVSKLYFHYPQVKIITACLDNCLNEVGYIIPGLGDAGDRTFNTLY